MKEEANLYLPARDACAHYLCGRPEATHVGFAAGGPAHPFEPPATQPQPERIASSFIQTEWTCTHCGAECDVWGVADAEWMECLECGGLSYLLCFVNAPSESEPKR
jgi:hypothetical protein